MAKEYSFVYIYYIFLIHSSVDGHLRGFHILAIVTVIFFFNELKCLFIILFSFLNRLIYFNWRIINLQHCDGFSHTSIWIGHRHTRIPSILSSASQVPPQPIPPGCHRAVALGALRHTSNLHWLSILHMVTYVLEKAMAPHSSTLAWKIPWMEEPGRL